MTNGDRFRVTSPAEGAPPADDARKVLLNAAPVVENGKRAAAAVVGKQPPLPHPDDEEVRDVMVLPDASSEEAATTADPSAMDVMTEEWHRGAERPSSNRAGKVCVAVRGHSRRNEGVPTPPLPKPLTKNYYCCRCCWRSG